MKTFKQLQEEIKNVPSVRELGGLGGGGGGTNAITAKAKGKTLKNRIKDVGKMATVPARFLLNIKSKPDPTEKFADSYKTPKEKVSSAISDYKKQKKVNEGAIAIPAVVGGISKAIPAIAAGVGAVGTYMQTRRGRPEGGEAKRYKKKNPNKKRKISRQQQKIIDLENKRGENLNNPANKVQNKIRTTEPKDRVNIDSPRTKSDDVLINPRPGEARKEFNLLTKYLKKQRSVQGNTYLKKKGIEEEAIANSLGGGQIAGTVEAGDDPPVKKKKKKKKKYIYGGRGSRKMWMNNK